MATIFTELNGKKCKTYLIGCTVEGQAVIVDPVAEFLDRYLAVLGYHRLKLVSVMDTHTHADHLSATVELARLTGCEIARHRDAPQPNVDRYLDDGDSLQVGRTSLQILHTPGHTPDSLSLYFEDRVLTGDCLLIGGTGRTDFAGGDAGSSYDSIVQKLFVLPDSTRVFPGHDYRGNTESTIGHEKRHNPRLAGKSREQYIDVMTNLGLPLPEKIQEVLQVNASESQDTEINYPSIAELNNVMQMSVDTLMHQLTTAHPPCVLDVREAREFDGESGHIPGSICIPLADLPQRYSELEAYRHSRIVAVCRAGVRSTTAAAILTGLGFMRVYNLRGGMLEWLAGNLTGAAADPLQKQETDS